MRRLVGHSHGSAVRQDNGLAQGKPQALAPAAGEEVSCTVTVACQAEALPELRAAGVALEADGTLFSTPCTVTENSTVLEALKTAAKAAGCPVTTQGSPAYVTAIGDLAAGAHGEASGWTYTVNGEMVMDSCDTRTVQAGDQILWTYVTAWT